MTKFFQILTLLMLVPCASLAGERSLPDSLTAPGRDALPAQAVSIALDLFVGTGNHEWIPSFGVRAGYGVGIDEGSAIRAFLEYSQYKLAPSGGFSAFTPSTAMRRDLALYASILIVRVFDIACGIYHTSSDAVSLTSGGVDSGRWGDSGKSEFRFYLSVGVQYAIPLTNHISLPVGIHYRALDYGTETYLTLRIGPEFSF